MATYIESFTDLQTWIANTNPHNVQAVDGADDELADALRAADHPSYGDDWEEWLEAQDWESLVGGLNAAQTSAAHRSVK